MKNPFRFRKKKTPSLHSAIAGRILTGLLIEENNLLLRFTDTSMIVNLPDRTFAFRTAFSTVRCKCYPVFGQRVGQDASPGRPKSLPRLRDLHRTHGHCPLQRLSGCSPWRIPDDDPGW